MATNYGPALMTMMGAGAIMDTVGSYFSAESEKTRLSLESAIDLENAKIARMGARNASMQGTAKQSAIKARASRIKSAQRVATAGAGFAVGDETSIDLATETDVISQADVEAAAYNAAMEAWGYETQASQLMQQSRAKKMNSNMISSTAAAGSTLLSGASSVASSWYQLDALGAFDER